MKNALPEPDRKFSLPAAIQNGLLFNLVCAVYFIWIAPVVVNAGDKAMRDPEATFVWLGVALALVCLGEVWAFPVKMRFVRQAIGREKEVNAGVFYLWIFHAVISIILLFQIAGCFGVKVGLEPEKAFPWWLGLLIPLSVIKELVFSAFLLSDKSDDSKSPDNTETDDPRYSRPSTREWIADAILVGYACLAYSATWSAITVNMKINDGHPVLTALNCFLAVLLFLIFYLPLRIPYWIEECSRIETTADKWRLAASLLVVLVPAMWLLR